MSSPQTRTQCEWVAVTCDLCGEATQDDLAVVLGWDGDQWRIDLCRDHYQRVGAQFDEWIAVGEQMPAKNGRRSPADGRTKSRASAPNADDWAYLESRGFTRHPGKKSAAELAALAARTS